jgi:hypothetical protein
MFGNKQRPNLPPHAESVLLEGMEDILSSGSIPGADTPAGALLNENPHARTEVAQMIEISRLIRENLSVQAEQAEDLGPAPGFYARVMARVEKQSSEWDFFFQPFARRLVYASMALAILVFAIIVFDHNPARDSEVAVQAPATYDQVNGAVLVSDDNDAPVVESPNIEADRGTVLVHLATFDQ